MSAAPSGSTPPLPPLNGWKSALEHTGIPTSWLRNPRLPSNKWLAFFGTVATLGGAYYYDRKECKRIQKEYIDKVKHLAEEPIAPWDSPRKIFVYACKWPGDEAYDRSLKWFRRHVRPILVAAAVDYEFKNGNMYGGLMRSLADDIRNRRRLELGIDKLVENGMAPVPGASTDPALKRKRELDGGVMIIGRNTLKEYMEGMRRGWTQSLEKRDADELLAKELANDGHFDESDSPTDREPLVSASTSPIVFSPLQLNKPSPKAHVPIEYPTVPPHLDVPPARIPEQPPLALVPYTSVLGFRNIPFMIWNFFNHRKDFKLGAEMAYRVVAKQTRPFEEPTSSEASEEQTGDLAFDVEAESYFRPGYDDTPKDIEKARTKYYASLAERLKTARALAHREREPTKDEKNYPPPTEVELSAERLKKEKEWREQLDGYEVLRKGKPVAWDERFEGAFKVFVEGEVPSPPPKDIAEDSS